MENKKFSTASSLKKVSTFSLQERLSALLGAKKAFKVTTLVHLPSIAIFPNHLRTNKLSISQPKATQKIAVHLLYQEGEKQPEGIHHTALDTHLCSRKQELHLLRYEQLFQEGHLPPKKITNWKIPRLLFLQKLFKL
jgi:hypothetical protein